MTAPTQGLNLDLSVLDHDDRAPPFGVVVDPDMVRRKDDHPTFERWRESPSQKGQWGSVSIHDRLHQSVIGKPNAGNRSGMKAVISATLPSSTRSTSRTWAR